MNSDTLIRQIAEADTYAPEYDLPDSARTSAAALTEIRRRIDTMDAKELTKPVEQEPRSSRSGWLVAATAFAVVIAVLGVALLVNQPTDEAPPATTPTTSDAAPSTTAPTTTLAAAVSAEERVVLDSYVEAFNAGDEEGFRALFSPAATQAAEGGFTNNLDAIVDEMRRLHLRGTTLSMDGCEPSGNRIMCTTIQDGPVEQAVLQVPEVVRRWYTIVEGEIVATEDRSITQGTVNWNPVWEEVVAWVATIDQDLGATFGGIYPYMPTDEAAIAWAEFAPLWRQATGGDTLVETAASLSAVLAFESAFNAADEGELRSVFDAGATYVLRHQDLGSVANQDVDWIVSWSEHTVAQETRMDIDLVSCRLVGESFACDIHQIGVVPQILFGANGLSTETFLIKDGKILGVEYNCTICVDGTVDADERIRDYALSQNASEAALMTWQPHENGSTQSGELWLKWAVLWDEAGRP